MALRTVSGHGGRLFELGDEFDFDVPLRDCGDGWTWRVPGIRCFDPESLSLDLDMAWVPYPVTARLVFPRCLRGESIRATGRGCPATVIASVTKWQLAMTVMAFERSVLSSGDVHTKVRNFGYSAVIQTDEKVEGEVYVELPFGGFCTYAGIGNALPIPSGVRITFDEGVVNEPAR